VATDRLKIYNGALLICGERQLASLTEAREPRHLLDNVWNDGGLRYCLEQAQWNFAMRTAKLTYDPDVEPAFGYRYAFEKTTDWVATSAVCQDPYYNVPLVQYADEIGWWFADITPIYAKWVSDSDDFGLNLANWPYSFTEYVKHFFASKIILKITSDKQRQQTLLGPPGRPDKGTLAYALQLAKNKDAMAKPAQKTAQGGWSSARQGGWGVRGRGDGGSGGSLIG